MAKMIKCECGFVARGTTDDAVVDVIRDHMRTDHPEAYSSVPLDDVRGWIEEV